MGSLSRGQKIKKMKKYLILALVILIGGGIGWFLFSKFEIRPDALPEGRGAPTAASEQNLKSNPTEPQKISISVSSSDIRNPKSDIRLYVPFASQAPTANWDAVHEESCEEAAAIMVAYAFAGKKMTPAIMEDELTKLIAWEKEKFGFFEDTNAAQTAQIMTDYFGLKADVEYTFDFEKIKKAIDEGKLVITLAAGRELHNPNFKQPGPIYHALVIKDYKEPVSAKPSRGLDGNKLITNDPGTRKGENYTYDFKVVKNASHEWVDDKEKILDGRQNLIIVSK